MQQIKKLFSNKWVMLATGLLLGAICVAAIRFTTYKGPAHAHYHANFAVYINGVREKFADSTYYQEVSACSVGGPIQPEQRAHMHDDVNSIVHVHDEGVTWGQFFENLNWYVGPNFIQARGGKLYTPEGDAKLHIMLNGDDYTGLGAITNRVIGSEDRLLVSYGDINGDELQKEYKTVASTAHRYNTTKDPASCAGMMEKVTTADRLHHLF
jgi:hypothetical protein